MTCSPGNALIVSTQRLNSIARLSCLDVAEAVCMPQSFVCSEAKCAHRWEPTGHQMTCCGMVAWSALGLRDRGEREKKGGQGQWIPDALLSWWDAMTLLPGLISSIRMVNREDVSQTSLFLCCAIVLANNNLYQHRLTKENWNPFCDLVWAIFSHFPTLPLLIMTAL